MRVTVSLFVVASLGLTACAETAANNNVVAYNSKIASHSNPFIAELNASTATEVIAAPAEGTASMTGTFLMQTPAGMTGIDKIGGQIDMSADFAAETITGTMYRFVETYTDNSATGISGSGSYSGTISFDPIAGSSISATGTGNFTTTDRQSHTMSTNLNGKLYRRAGGELASTGTLSAAATGGGLTHGLVGDYFVTE